LFLDSFDSVGYVLFKNTVVAAAFSPPKNAGEAGAARTGA
jgi:hypothetical protein